MQTKKIVNRFLLILILFVSFLILYSTFWVKDTFGLVDVEKLIYHLFVPLKGAEDGMVISYLKEPLLKAILSTTITLLIFLYNYKYDMEIKISIRNSYKTIKFIKTFKIIFTIFIFVFALYIFDKELGVMQYIKNQATNSTFIENNYVDPKKATLIFPNNKKNLIHIYVESLENTYASKDLGGAFDENLIPHLTRYAKEYTSFTNNSGGGFYNSTATGWTIAGMIAQTAGVNLKASFGNELGNYSKTLPGAYTLGEILDKEGYNQLLLIGSYATFGGRDVYFQSHGNYTIKDYSYAVENGWIPNDYYVWWGYEDSKLFEFAKNEVLELSNHEEPFNLTLLTTNTHHIGGYLESDCEIKFDEQFKNVIYCSDKQIYEFVEWVKKQSFYDDTVIVITGDHLSMDPDFFSNIGNYERTNYNVFINSSVEATNKNDRLFYTMDMYPTILASMGVEISGNRLALGTNLFSNEKTFYEKFGIENVEREYGLGSTYYRDHIIFGL